MFTINFEVRSILIINKPDNNHLNDWYFDIFDTLHALCLVDTYGL